MGTFRVEQRTKDAFFNATSLLKQWNDMVELNVGNPIFKKKELPKFFENANTKDFIDVLIMEENLHMQNSAYVKSRARADRGGGTWMHPLLFIKFAMWLNPRFEVQVLKFVYDQMIAYRNEAGDAYRKLSAAVARVVSLDYMPVAMSRIARAINLCVFNRHETAVRNKYGSETDMRKLFELEHKVASLLDEGFINSIGEVMAYLKRQWVKANAPGIFSK